MGDHYCCKFCYQRYDECNCPSDMTPVRPTGEQWLQGMLGKTNESSFGNSPNTPVDERQQRLLKATKAAFAAWNDSTCSLASIHNYMADLKRVLDEYD